MVAMSAEKLQEMHAAANIFALAGEVRELKERKEALEAELKEVNGDLDAKQLQLYDAMKAQGVKNFNFNGKQYIQNRQLWASPMAEAKATVFEALKQHGYGDLVQETVNTQTFSALIREHVGDIADVLDNPETIAEFGEDADGLDEATKEQLLLNMRLPEWMRGMVNITVKKQIQMRKAGK